MSRLVHFSYLRWLPAVGGFVGAAAAAVVAAELPAVSLEDIARLAGFDTAPDPATIIPLISIVVGSVCWAALYLVWGRGGVLDPRRHRRPDMRRITVNRGVMPVQRMAPPAWPVVAADVGASLPRERSLPVDLDQPLSAFDPHAIPSMSFESIRRSGFRPIS